MKIIIGLCISHCLSIPVPVPPGSLLAALYGIGSVGDDAARSALTGPKVVTGSSLIRTESVNANLILGQARVPVAAMDLPITTAPPRRLSAAQNLPRGPVGAAQGADIAPSAFVSRPPARVLSTELNLPRGSTRDQARVNQEAITPISILKPEGAIAPAGRRVTFAAQDETRFITRNKKVFDADPSPFKVDPSASQSDLAGLLKGPSKQLDSSPTVWGQTSANSEKNLATLMGTPQSNVATPAQNSLDELMGTQKSTSAFSRFSSFMGPKSGQ